VVLGLVHSPRSSHGAMPWSLAAEREDPTIGGRRASSRVPRSARKWPCGAHRGLVSLSGQNVLMRAG
jgi:hypothetical protein